jgi:hypothetical protein
MEERRARVAADSHGPRAEFDDIEVGRLLGEMEWVVTDEMIDTQCALDADYDVWYSLDSPWGGRIAPPRDRAHRRQVHQERARIRRL